MGDDRIAIGRLVRRDWSGKCIGDSDERDVGRGEERIEHHQMGSIGSIV